MIALLGGGALLYFNIYSGTPSSPHSKKGVAYALTLLIVRLLRFVFRFLANALLILCACTAWLCRKRVIKGRRESEKEFVLQYDTVLPFREELLAPSHDDARIEMQSLEQTKKRRKRRGGRMTPQFHLVKKKHNNAWSIVS